MKKIILLFLIAIGSGASAQSIYQLNQDSITLGKSNGTSSVTVPGKLNLKGLPKGNVSVRADGRLIHNDTLYATASGTSAVVETIQQLISYSGTSTAVAVKDTLRGGNFSYTPIAMPIDTGITFPATGKGSGTWVRLGNTSVADAKWYNVTKTGTLNGLRLNNATHSPYVSTLNINFPNDTLLIEQPIYVENRDLLNINVNTTLKHPNEVAVPLSATAASGATTIYITDANKKFLVNQTIGLYSTAAPIVDTEAGQNRPGMSASRINAVFSDRVVLDSATRYGYNIDSGAVAYNVSNLFVFRNATNAKISGGKYDGNKAHAFNGYPYTKQTESDLANNAISLIGSTDIRQEGLDIYNTNLNGIKWTRNNYRIYLNDSRIRNAAGKNLIANYGGGDMFLDNVVVDSSYRNDNINFNGDINGYTLNNIFVKNVRSLYAGRWGIRAQGSQTRIYIDGFTSTNDGGAIQTEGEDSKLAKITIKSPKDFRCGCNTVEATLRIAGARTLVDGLTIDSVGTPANMIRLEEANGKIANAFFRNMPSTVSSGKTVIRGLSGATNWQLTNITYDNIDQTKIMRNNSGGAYFGDLTSSASTIVMSDRPNFSGSTVARNRFGNYSSPNGTLTFTDNTSGGDINLANANTWIAAQTFSNTTFPLVIERSSGAFGQRFTRGGVEQGALFFDAANLLTLRNATGTLFTNTAGTTTVAFNTGPTMPTAAAGTNTTQGATTAFVFAERSNSFTLTNKTISGASNTLTNIGNSSLTNSSISFATGTSGTAPNWTTSPVSLGGTATLNIPNAATSGVTGGLLSKTQYDGLLQNQFTSPQSGAGLYTAGDIRAVGTIRADGNLFMQGTLSKAGGDTYIDASGNGSFSTLTTRASISIGNTSSEATLLRWQSANNGASYNWTMGPAAPAYGGPWELKYSTTGILSAYSTGQLNLPTAPTTSAGAYDLLTRNTSNGNLEKVASSTFLTPTDTATFIPKAWPSGTYTITGNRKGTGKWYFGQEVIITGESGYGITNNSTYSQTVSVNGNTGFSYSNTGTNGDGPTFRAPRIAASFGNPTTGAKANIYGDGTIQAVLNPYSSGTALPVVYNSTNDRFETNSSLVSQVVEISGTSQSASANTIYIPHNASLTTITLPSSATVGQLIQIVGEGAGGWRLAQNASQQIVGVGIATTVGTGGYIESTDANCTISVRYTNTNKWTITSSQGTLTVN